MPTRDQFLAEAKDMFAKTKSLDDIVELLLQSVGSLLVVPPLSDGAPKLTMVMAERAQRH
jgi:hypothetical protein